MEAMTKEVVLRVEDEVGPVAARGEVRRVQQEELADFAVDGDADAGLLSREAQGDRVLSHLERNAEQELLSDQRGVCAVQDSRACEAVQLKSFARRISQRERGCR